MQCVSTRWTRPQLSCSGRSFLGGTSVATWACGSASPRGGSKISWGGPPPKPKTGKRRLHFDLAPADGSDQQAEVDRLLVLGASHVDVGQHQVGSVVLADPDGNEFCLSPA